MKNKQIIAAGACLLALIASQALAGPGHDHGESAPAASSNSPKRLPDGSVFLPKNSQRQLAVRTQLAEERPAAQTIELTGRVSMDPNAGGRVQPTQAGRLEAGPRGLPSLGQFVRKGEALAVVRSSASAIERANQQAQAAELRAQLDLARRRVARLSELETRELGAERLSRARLSMDRPVEELMPWVDEFNALLARLDGAYRQLESFNADVAHELRTPLTTLMGQTEVALRRPRSPEALRSVLESNLEELQRLSGIVNDMLFLARADGGEIVRGSPPASLREQALAAVEFHEAALAEAGLETRVEGEAMARFDAGLVRRALSNLLGNAIRHSAEGSTIAVSVDSRAGCPGVFVSNPGGQIAPDELRRMFDRFYRGEEPRSGGDGRHGLGLAIVAAIAAMHGGRAFATSAGGVTTVGFTIGEAARRGAGAERAAPSDSSPGKAVARPARSRCESP